MESIGYYGIGNTPLMRISSVGGSTIYAKLEYRNPSGSIKDRSAYYMLKNAELKGIFKKKKGLVEVSSGNTGISLAMFGALLGLKVNIILPKSATKERLHMINHYGGTVIYVPDSEWREGAISLAREIESYGELVFLNQYENDGNWQSHYETTGKEIIKDMGNNKIDYFIAGIGTGGTISGIAKRLKEYDPDIKVIGVVPDTDEKIDGLKNPDTDEPQLYKNYKYLMDEIMKVKRKEALEMYILLGKSGYSAGISSGAIYSVARRIAKREDDTNIVIVFPDHSNRYMEVINET